MYLIKLTTDPASTLRLTWILALTLLLPAGARCESRTDPSIATASHRLERTPGDRAALLALGDAYARKGRETGDSSYFGLAEKALRRCVDLHPDDSRCRRHLAYVLSLQHDFKQAAEEAQVAIDLNPHEADALGILGDSRIELGEYTAAQDAYQRMVSLRENLASLSRLSGLKSLKGDTAGAIADLERAIVTGKASGEPAESIAWAQWQLGMEHFHIGRMKPAEAAFRSSLASFPDYYRGLAGLALIHGARGNYRGAITLYEKATATVPLPEYAIALGHLYSKLRRAEDAAAQYALVEQLAKLGGGLYNREFVVFRLDRGEGIAEALEQAQKDLAVRKDVYGYDTYAWALFKNGHPAPAREAIDQALKLGTRDAKLFFHAGMIYRSLGEARAAHAYFKRALATNPHFHLLHADEVRHALKSVPAKRRKDA